MEHKSSIKNDWKDALIPIIWFIGVICLFVFPPSGLLAILGIFLILHISKNQ